MNQDKNNVSRLPLLVTEGRLKVCMLVCRSDPGFESFLTLASSFQCGLYEFRYRTRIEVCGLQCCVYNLQLAMMIRPSSSWRQWLCPAISTLVLLVLKWMLSGQALVQQSTWEGYCPVLCRRIPRLPLHVCLDCTFSFRTWTRQFQLFFLVHQLVLTAPQE